MSQVAQPCPFCGGSKVGKSTDEFGQHRVGCNDCGAEGPDTYLELEARPRWNKRADQGEVKSGFVRFEYVGDAWRLVDLNGDIIAYGLGDAYESARCVRRP